MSTDPWEALRDIGWQKLPNEMEDDDMRDGPDWQGAYEACVNIARAALAAHDAAVQPNMLAAALVWARNHLDCTDDRALRDRVIERLDRVLKHREPTMADMQAFREFYGVDDQS